jgi:hypothetical protein
MSPLLRFRKGNAKLPKWIWIFDLPAGHTCPFAKDCKCRADRETGKLTDGLDLVFRCYAASIEAAFKGARDLRWANYDALKGQGKQDIVDRISAALLVGGPFFVRIHSSGDFYSQTYFDAWLEVARKHPKTVFYAYTKALPYWTKRIGSIPANLRLTASRGGTHDNLITQYGLRSAVVVESAARARELGLEIDHDDRHAFGTGGDFALLIHGAQPPDGPMAKAWAKVKAALGGYGINHRNRMSLLKGLKLAGLR